MDKRVAIGGGVILGGLVVAWQFVAAAAGLTALFPLVATAIELVVVVGTLAQTRGRQGYGAQVLTGVTVAAVATALILPGAVAVGAASADVIAGGVGTLVSGLFITLIAAVPLRRRAG